MFYNKRIPTLLNTRRWVVTGILALAISGIAFTSVSSATASIPAKTVKHHPVQVTVFSPGRDDSAGKAGAGNVVDLALDAATPADNGYLSAAKGYKPFFNNPTSPAFHPGPDLGAPGLVVLLSTTKTIPGTAFHGPGTNLAGLFQINGVAMVQGGTLAETWNTWLVGKPIAGTGHSVLTVFVVTGTAPSRIQGDPEHLPNLISNVVRIPFSLAGQSPTK